MSIELLRTRTEVLLRSVGEVDAVLRVLQTNRDAVQQMSNALRKARQTAEGLVRPGDATLEELRLLKESQDPDSAASEALATTLRVLSGMEETVPDLVKALKGPVTDLGEIAERAVQFDNAFVADVSNDTSNVRTKIQAFLEKLDAGAATVPEMWQIYFDEIVPAANSLFSDYMDLLGGVSIRERGVAISALSEEPDPSTGAAVEPCKSAAVCRIDQLCAMADWHVTNELAVRVDWASSALAIPGRDGVRHLTSWPILRLGFASWSIWGMPVGGHEYGRLVVPRRAEVVRGWAAELAAFGEEGLRLLIADTIGAWTEGPAYACALLFLSLDPRHQVGGPGHGYVSNAERATYVRTCLRNQIVAFSDRAPESADAGYGYLDFVDQVVDRWTEALPAGADGDEEAAERRRLLDSLPGRVWKAFGMKRPFAVGDWRESVKVWGNLARGEPLPSDPPLGMRHLMNAAWYARCADDVSPKRTAAEIERLALRAGHDMAMQQQRAGRSAPGAGRRG